MFWATVISQKVTDIESVALDKEWLSNELVLNGNNAGDVKTRLNLPKTGLYTITIRDHFLTEYKAALAGHHQIPG